MIEVTVSRRDIMNAPAGVPLEWWARNHVLGKLRDAGAPVSGVLELSLNQGVLTKTDCFERDATVYSWRERLDG